MSAIKRLSSRPGLVGLGFGLLAALLGLALGADSASAGVGCFR